MLEVGRVGGQHGVHFGADAQRGLVRPQPGDVARCVAAAAEDEERPVALFHEREAGPVRRDAQVEAAEPVAAEGVGAALEHDGRRVIGLHARPDAVLEELDVLVVFDAVVQGHVQGVVGARVVRVRGPVVVRPAGAGEERGGFVFVEGERHDAVGGPEGLLDAVAVVDVDVDVEHARVVQEELQDGEHDVVDVAEA